MGTRTGSSLIAILSFLIVFSSILNPSEALCATGVYWGQNGTSNEYSLRNACAFRHEIVSIAFLTNFGSGRQPVLNLTSHCDPAAGTCRNLSEQVRFCQGQGVKVLLSLGGPIGDYEIASPEDANEVANYLWVNFLSGNPRGPLGDVALDGVDFAVNSPRSSLHWDDLADVLSEFSTEERKIYLTAAPECVYPDPNLDAAIKTGVFDFVWVQFYNNPSCDFSDGPGGYSNLVRSWNEWSTGLPAGSQLSIGLPAHRQAAGSGFVRNCLLSSIIFPEIQRSPNYGGMMLWNYYWDEISSYSVQVSWDACNYNVTQQTANIKMFVRK